MASFKYIPIVEKVEESYKEHTNLSIYEAVGNVDFTKATLIVEAENEEESEKIRIGITDIRMWKQI